MIRFYIFLAGDAQKKLDVEEERKKLENDEEKTEAQKLLEQDEDNKCDEKTLQRAADIIEMLS